MELHPESRQEVDEIIDQVNVATNMLPRLDGFTPYQHVFGREPRIPGLDLRDDMVVEASGIAMGESMHEKRAQIRQIARKKVIEAEEEERVRRAVTHRTRPQRGPFLPGQMVYFWRLWPKEKKAYWHGPGFVVGEYDGRSRIWVSYGTKMYKCSPEQLKHVSAD